MLRLTKWAAAASLLMAVPAIAQQGGMQGMDHSKMQGMNHDNMPGMNTPFMPAEMAMHEKMMKAKGANASETWVRKMIEHHRGAVAMSQIVIRQAPDAKTRQMAQKSIAEQNKSIGELQAMLRSMGKRPQ
ncbi:MAG: DUF305 domain-containing protein [Sphingobium sp.]|jgi:uncharacterized protein (DUF305 family)|uniref:DUF305 domain-containing protein n=1 Tax=Sphingobium sp. TaxID=1912891 RepID=UPI003BB03BC0